MEVNNKISKEHTLLMFNPKIESDMVLISAVVGDDAVARMILDDVGMLAKLSDFRFGELVKMDGVTSNRAKRLLAAIELGRRVCDSRSKCVDKPICCPKDAYDMFKYQFAGLMQETFLVSQR